MTEAVQERQQEDPLVRRWERFLKDYYRAEINEAALAWPRVQGVEIDWWDLDKHDADLAQRVLDNPTQTLSAAEQAVRTVDLPLPETIDGQRNAQEALREGRIRLQVRPVRLPEHARIEVRDLRSEHLGKLVAVRGLVKKATEVRPKIEDAVFQCGRCLAYIRVPQEEHLVLREPLECYEDQGGCGRNSTFKLVTEATKGRGQGNVSVFVDTQKLEIQEFPENLRGGDQPQRLASFTERDQCGRLSPGDRVFLNGVLRSSVKKTNGVKSTLLDIHLDIVSLEMEQQEYEEVEINAEEEEEIRRFSRDPELFDKMRSSIAPDLFGLELEKETMLLQLFGGLHKKLPSGLRLRGDIHVLFVGDPGVAKSQLLRYAAKLAPRGIYTSGKSSSAAGLTAAAVKDEFGEGRWTLEAGALVLADKGMACIDEMDKMDKQDQSSMHEAMEQQTISVAKAGITATLQSRCSILGAANPKLGRFDEFAPLAEQINFPPALMSRFDVIFVLTDKPDANRDAQLASHLLERHRGGAMFMQLEHRPDSVLDREAAERAVASANPTVKPDFLRKYVAYAKRTCYPVLTDDAKRRIQEYYVNLRRTATSQEGGGPIPLTARQLEAFVRLAEASAKIRLSDEVEEADAERAIRIVETYLRRLNRGEGGIMDIDAVASGVTHNQRDRLNAIKSIIRELTAGRQEGAALEDVVAEAERKGIPVDKARDAVKRLKELNQVFEPRTDEFRVL